MRKINKKVAAGIAGTAIAVAGSGIAFAYWTAGGSGSGSAGAGNVNGITVNLTTSPTALYPGQDAQTISGDFTNGNSGPVYVHQVTVTIANTGGATWSSQSDSTKPACTASDFSITQPAATNAEVASGSNVGSWSGKLQLVDGAGNQDNCKGVTVPLQLSSN